MLDNREMSGATILLCGALVSTDAVGGWDVGLSKRAKLSTVCQCYLASVCLFFDDVFVTCYCPSLSLNCFLGSQRRRLGIGIGLYEEVCHTFQTEPYQAARVVLVAHSSAAASM